METIKTDHLIIGSGIAGLTYAINLKRGRIIILTKKRPSDSNTNYAQGGIAAALDRDDSFVSHLQDTLMTGDGLSKPEVVELMVKEAPKVITELEELGVRFTKVMTDGKVSFALGKEGGHSHRRIVFAQDRTGAEIETTLLNRVKDRLTIIEGGLALDLIVEDGECFGAYYLDTISGEIGAIVARSTLIATGGIGQVYRLTTNPRIATGDGIGMAFRAGARIANMEFIQFHPTGVYNMMIDGRVFLISEAVRGEGGILKTVDGEPFMLKYDPRGCLAPRDIVARAIEKEMVRSGRPFVYLDLTHLDPDWIRRRFPTIYKTCLDFGLDITRSPIPVAPAAHYLCGGIVVDIDGRTNIKRLYAAGEVAMTGVHGANRLASNSLLEAVVFAKRAAVDAGESGEVDFTPPPLKLSGDFPEKQTETYIQSLKDLMTRKAGIVRRLDELKEGKKRVREMLSEVIGVINRSPRLWQLKNMLTSAYLILHSALMRRESRGLHYLEDFPHKDDHYLKDTVVDPEPLYHEIVSHR